MIGLEKTPEGALGASSPAARLAAPALRVLITLALILWLGSRTDLRALTGILSSVRGSYLALAIAVHIGAFALAGVRWWLLYDRLVPAVGLRRVAAGYVLGTFFNNFLPTSFGGDAVRTLHLRRQGLATDPLIGSAIVDRAIGFAMVLVMGLTAALAAPDFAIARAHRTLLAALLLAVLAGGAFALSPGASGLVDWLHARLRHSQLRRRLLTILRLCLSYRYAPRIVLLAMAMSLVMQAMIIAVYYILGRAVGIDLSLASYFAIVSAAFLVAALPISLGGLGVREGAVVALLASAHVGNQPALALSMMYLLVLWAASLPGAVAFVVSRPGAPRGG